MNQLVKEETIIVGLVDGLLLIRRERVWSNGARLGGDFMVNPSVTGWLADQLELAADDKVVEVSLDAAPDHLNLYIQGGDHGEPINVNVHNDRDAIAPYGRSYTLGGMYPDVARRLAAELRAYQVR